MEIAGIPVVMGAIDGTHIRIIAPSQDEDIFVNRKSCIPSIHKLSMTHIISNFNGEWFDAALKANAAFIDNLCF